MPNIRISTVANAVLETFSELTKDEDIGKIPKSVLTSEAIFQHYFPLLPQEKQEELAQQYPILIKYLKRS